MGLFDKLFGKTNPEQPTTTPATNAGHQEEWEFYLTNIDGNPGSIMVDLGLISIAPIPDHETIVWVSVKMNQPKENGLSTSGKIEILGQIEDSLVTKLNKKHNCTFVGRATTDGNRDFYFYFGNTTLYDKSISEAMVQFPKYTYDFGTKADKDWKSYFDFLYPLPKQLQSIQNRRVIEQLEKGGDKLTKAREVDHWIYFKTEADRETFLQKISTENFSIVDKDFDKELDEAPFGLHIKRVDKVDQESVDQYVIHLWQLASESNGDYDGWETSIEKD